jgi:hypothetical protein
MTSVDCTRQQGSHYASCYSAQKAVESMAHFNSLCVHTREQNTHMAQDLKSSPSKQQDWSLSGTVKQHLSKRTVRCRKSAG